ncbi:MAG: calcium/sodium antiporter [Deltaproteobacteria bacterium]|nr:calcium/sodium antiporter [Deltaproteobacteria bacterium]
MNDYVALAIGIVSAGIGGDLFVRGAVGLSRWARVSPAIIGVTVAAFATSSPELSVSINSAIAGTPQLGLGDVLGSNVVNVALILGLALTISGIQCPQDSVRRDFPVALLVFVITGVLILDGTISRFDGALLLVIFSVWLVAVLVEANKQRNNAKEAVGKRTGWTAAALCVVGLAFLFVAGRLIVSGAIGVAAAYGMDEFIIGATIVAVGTSVPELATTIVAKLRGEDEMGLGTILGSNIFNGLFIVAIAAVIHPITVDPRSVWAALAFGLSATALTFPTRKGFIQRWRGTVLLALYAAYLAAILMRRA